MPRSAALLRVLVCERRSRLLRQLTSVLRVAVVVCRRRYRVLLLILFLLLFGVLGGLLRLRMARRTCRGLGGLLEAWCWSECFRLMGIVLRLVVVETAAHLLYA